MPSGRAVQTSCGQQDLLPPAPAVEPGVFPHPPQPSGPHPAPAFSPRWKEPDLKDQPFSLTYPRTAITEDIGCALLVQGCVAGLEVRHTRR